MFLKLWVAVTQNGNTLLENRIGVTSNLNMFLGMWIAVTQNQNTLLEMLTAVT